jgi:hypothetical protein
MTRNNFSFEEYLNKVAQKIDWLVTSCSSTVMARESARNHLNDTVREILSEVYNVGYAAGEKDAGFYYDQRFRVMKFKTQEKTSKELRKEILDQVLKEYKLNDEKIKKKLVKGIEENEDELEKSVPGQEN